jgi:hypothetical protein
MWQLIKAIGLSGIIYSALIGFILWQIIRYLHRRGEQVVSAPPLDEHERNLGD